MKFNEDKNKKLDEEKSKLKEKSNNIKVNEKVKQNQQFNEKIKQNQIIQRK